MAQEDTNWISVGNLADSFAPGSNALRRSGDLADRVIRLNFADGWTEYAFQSDSVLTARRAETSKEAIPYLATSLRAGIYFVDFLHADGENVSTSLILDLNRGVATRILGRLPGAESVNDSLFKRANDHKELTQVDVSFAHASIDNAFDPGHHHHAETRDLIGLRLRHRYNPNELYEHIYLNEKRYCWHCLEGAEAGLGDVERCHYYAIDTDLYLLVWREKIIPTLGIVMMDLRALKTTGKIIGYKDDTMTAVSNFPVGAVSQIVNRSPVMK